MTKHNDPSLSYSEFPFSNCFVHLFTCLQLINVPPVKLHVSIAAILVINSTVKIVNPFHSVSTGIKNIILHVTNHSNYSTTLLQAYNYCLLIIKFVFTQKLVLSNQLKTLYYCLVPCSLSFFWYLTMYFHTATDWDRVMLSGNSFWKSLISGWPLLSRNPSSVSTSLEQHSMGVWTAYLTFYHAASLCNAQ